MLNSELESEILNLKKGGHLCLFYEKDAAEQMPALIPFIQDGLNKDERFIYIADDQTVDELTRRLEEGGIDVRQESASGRLALLTRKEWRQAGTLDYERKSRQVQDFMTDASRSGYKGIRFAMEMTWTLSPDIQPATLQQWEATINTLFNSAFPGRIICQYNRKRLSPEMLMAAIYTHPVIILGEEVYPNMFYQAPLILDGNGIGQSSHDTRQRCSAQVEWMISQLKKARLAERDRARLLEMRIALAESEREGQRRLAEEALAWLGAIVTTSNDAIISKDLNGIIQSWNHGAEQLFGYKPQEVVGKPVTILIPRDRSDEEPEILARIRRGEQIDHYETVRQHKDGHRLHISLTVSPIKNHDGKIIGVSKIARDITDRKKAEAELLRWQQELEIRVASRTEQLSNAHEQLRREFEERKRLESEIAKAVEREQLRLGQQLHDGLGQELIGVTYQLSALHDRVAKLSPARGREIKKLENILRNSANQTRDLARDFYPVELENGGLAEALRRLADTTKESYGVSCRVFADKSCQDQLAHSIAIQFFRIAQEAVHNTIKHAQAKRISIRLALRQGQLILTIKDNGVGFPLDGKGKPKGMGLRIMQHRAGMIGGRLSFSNVPAGGAVVVCSMPAAANIAASQESPALPRLPAKLRSTATAH